MGRRDRRILDRHLVGSCGWPGGLLAVWEPRSVADLRLGAASVEAVEGGPFEDRSCFDDLGQLGRWNVGRRDVRRRCDGCISDIGNRCNGEGRRRRIGDRCDDRTHGCKPHDRWWFAGGRRVEGEGRKRNGFDRWLGLHRQRIGRGCHRGRERNRSRLRQRRGRHLCSERSDRVWCDRPIGEGPIAGRVDRRCNVDDRFPGHRGKSFAAHSIRRNHGVAIGTFAQSLELSLTRSPQILTTSDDGRSVVGCRGCSRLQFIDNRRVSERRGVADVATLGDIAQ